MNIDYILLPGELWMDFEWHKKQWLTKASTLMPVWLIQEPVQQVVPSVFGWMWRILEVTLEWSHLFPPTEQDQESLLQILN